MKICQLRFEYIPRIVDGYEDGYESVALFQALVRHKSRNGNDTQHYVCYYPDAAHAFYLRKFFITNEDCFNKLRDIRPRSGPVSDFHDKYVRREWRDEKEAAGTEWAPLLRLLSHFDLNGEKGCYETNFRFDDSPEHLFPWNGLPSGEWNDVFDEVPFFRSAEGALSCVPRRLAAGLRAEDTAEADGVFVENGAEKIPDGAFRHSRAREIVLPATVRTVGADAFDGCCSLERLCLPSDGKIAFTALRGCGRPCPGPAWRLCWV